MYEREKKVAGLHYKSLDYCTYSGGSVPKRWTKAAKTMRQVLTSVETPAH